MKVYVVTYETPVNSEREIDKIFLSKENAEKYVEYYDHDDWRFFPKIEELSVTDYSDNFHLNTYKYIWIGFCLERKKMIFTGGGVVKTNELTRMKKSRVRILGMYDERVSLIVERVYEENLTQEENEQKLIQICTKLRKDILSQLKSDLNQNEFKNWLENKIT